MALFTQVTLQFLDGHRSVTVHGTATLIDGDERVHALSVISEHVMPGRSEEVRPSHEKEILMTGDQVEIESASAKFHGPTDDEDEDMDAPVWAGVMPL